MKYRIYYQRERWLVAEPSGEVIWHFHTWEEAIKWVNRSTMSPECRENTLERSTIDEKQRTCMQTTVPVGGAIKIPAHDLRMSVRDGEEYVPTVIPVQTPWKFSEAKRRMDEEMANHQWPGGGNKILPW